MRNVLFIIIIFLLSSSAYSQKIIYLKKKDYEGCIFPKEHFIFNTIENEKARYTPTLEDIKRAETILSDSINIIIHKEQPYRYSSKPVINKKNLKKYKRQYVGFIDKDDNIVIWINFIQDKGINKERLCSDLIITLDGGAYYWNIYINIGTRELSYMYVNGIS